MTERVRFVCDGCGTSIEWAVTSNPAGAQLVTPAKCEVCGGIVRRERVNPHLRVLKRDDG